MERQLFRPLNLFEQIGIFVAINLGSAHQLNGVFKTTIQLVSPDKNAAGR
jgi:hypothetical protein